MGDPILRLTTTANRKVAPCLPQGLGTTRCAQIQKRKQDTTRYQHSVRKSLTKEKSLTKNKGWSRRRCLSGVGGLEGWRVGG